MTGAGYAGIRRLNPTKSYNPGGVAIWEVTGILEVAQAGDVLIRTLDRGEKFQVVGTH